MTKTKYGALLSNLEEKILRGELKKGEKVPTETELAQAYGISRQTVRKALSLLIEKGLMKGIQGSGYYVTYAVKKQPKEKHIAVITTFISDYIFPAILRTVESTLSKHNYTVSIYATNNSVTSERSILQSLANNSVSGIIVEGTKAALPNPNIGLYTALADSGVMIVFFNSIYPGLSHPNIKSATMDDYGGGAYLTSRMIEEGHTAIGGIFKADDLQGMNRYAGFVNTLADRSIPIVDQNILWFNTENKFLNGEKTSYTYSRLNEVIQSCTGIVCYSDLTAAILMKKLSEMSTTGESRVTAVYSFDNYNHISPVEGVSFFSLGYPRDMMGELISTKLLRMIDGSREQSDMIPWILP